MHSCILLFAILNSSHRHCYREEGNKNADCPVCTSNLNKLGQRLPYAHCANSKLICSISGLPLNENNPPMALPNGQVYGYNVSSVKPFSSRLSTLLLLLDVLKILPQRVRAPLYIWGNNLHICMSNRRNRGLAFSCWGLISSK